MGTNDNMEYNCKAAQIVAQKVGISTRTFQRAKVVIEKGDSKMKESIRSGKMSISFAEKTIRNKEIKKQRIARLMKSCGHNDSFNTDIYKLFTGNFIEKQSNIADNSIDLIFTDPPYTKESLPLYKDLGNMAYRVLKDGGSLLCYAGHYALLEVGKLLESCQLTYWWLIVVEHSGNIT
jgi:16S rRNA G966 N2-methylase RsmD